MLHFLADENFNGHAISGLLKRNPTIDIVRVQDVGLAGEDDEAILAWAARAGRIVVDHDVTTMSSFAWERVARGERMAGVFEVPERLSVAQIIEEVVLLVVCSTEREWEGKVLHLPL